MEHVNVPGAVSGRLRSSAPHVRSVRKDDIIRQCHLRDGILKAQGTSTFAIANPECPIRRYKCNKTFACTRESVMDELRLLPDVMSRLKCNLRQNL